MQRFIEYLFDNLFDIITLLVAAYLVIRNQITPFGPNDTPQVLTAILAVLGLLAVSGLWDRHRRLSRIQQVSDATYSAITRRLNSKARANDFFTQETVLSNLSPNLLSTASTIYLSGMTLNRTTRNLMDVLITKLRDGTTVRIMLLDPKEELADELSERSFSGTPEYWRTRITQTLQTLSSMPSEETTLTGKLELGLLQYIPSFGMILIDPDKQHGKCFVELYHHKSPGKNPSFVLQASEDTEWYPFFREQFELQWKSCHLQKLDGSSWVDIKTEA